MGEIKEIDRQKPQFFFFQYPEEALKKEGIASALQSFETTIMLIAYGRWPSIIPLMWGACEALLRVKYTNKNHDAITIQNKFKSDSKLSDALNDSAHELRKLRNDISHKGYMPRDTPRCIKLYFMAGVPYLDCLLKDITGIGLFEKLYPKGKGGVWDVFKDTRKVVTKKINKSGSSIEDALLFLILKVRETFSPTYIPRALEEIQDSDEETLWITEARLKNTLIKHVKNDQNNDCFDLSDVSCPVCGSDVLASFLWKGKGESWCFDRLTPVGCYKCNYLVRDQDLIKTFFQVQLTEELIGKLESDNPPLAQSIPV